MIGYFKGQPTEYVLRYSGGNIVRAGQSLSFYYLPLNTNVVAVPTSSIDAGFVFNETTNNYQSVTIQGQFTYHIENPRQAATLLNFMIDPRNHQYLSKDPEKLPQRVANAIQMQTRSQVQSRSLEETLQQTEEIAASVLASIRESGMLQSVGVELLNLFFVSIKPTPEVGKALEATYREALLRRADEAIYSRRAAGVEEERKIKENELNTDITLAQQRQSLIDLEGANKEKEAQFRGRAFEEETAYKLRVLESELKLYQDIAPRTLLAVAMKTLGENAAKVGNLTVTSEMLSSLLNGTDGAAPASGGARGDHGTH